MSEGMIRWYNVRKGFGFIAGDKGPDVFLHYSAIADKSSRKLQEGDIVEFELVQGEKGPKAANVIRKQTKETAQQGKGE